MQIKDITLLTKDEAENIDPQILQCEHSSNFNYNFGYNEFNLPETDSFCDWWLKDSGNKDSHIMRVTWKGNIKYKGAKMNLQDVCVRPVLVADSLENMDLYEMINIFGYDWIKISNNKLLCFDAVANYPFNEQIDNEVTFEDSDIKKYLIEWALNKGIIKQVENQ